jgi:ribosomal protein S27AE
MARRGHPVRCDQHVTRMFPIPRSADIPEIYRCAEPGCTRHYAEERGYFDVNDDSVLADEFQRRCPKCGKPMFLTEAGEREEIWRCPFSQCAHELRMAS